MDLFCLLIPLPGIRHRVCASIENHEWSNIRSIFPDIMKAFLKFYLRISTENNFRTHKGLLRPFQINLNIELSDNCFQYLPQIAAVCMFL